MPDELGRPVHEKPATTKTDSTAPVIDPALEPEVTNGSGLHDRTPSAIPPDSPSSPGVADPRRP